MKQFHKKRELYIVKYWTNQRNCMLSESYIKSRLQILRNWVIKNTNLQGDDIDILANKIFMKYYAKCM